MLRSTRLVGPIGVRSTAALGAALLALASTPAQAQNAWTDWTSFTSTTVTGTLDFLGTPVGVTYSGGGINFVQTGCGTNYWTNPDIYTNPADGVPNPPTNCEIISLFAGGTKTITFDTPVVDPLFAIVSWNGQTSVPFSGMNGAVPFVPTLEIVDQTAPLGGPGCGFWGCGTISVAGNVLSSAGESHGTIRLLGTYTSFSFTDATEGWHGIHVGAVSLAPTAIPEPGTVTLFAAGLLALGGVAARRRRG